MMPRRIEHGERMNSNVARLATAQALAGANSTVVYATGAIIGHMLAPRAELATLPISIFVVGMALSTLPAGLLARRHGRRAALLTGTLCGVIVGLLAALALYIQSFTLFCVAMLFGGAYAAVVLTFRFAATECVSAQERPRAMSTVMIGGIVSGIVGPQLATATMDLMPPHTYVVTYLAAAVVAAISAIVLSGIRFVNQVPASLQARGRPIGEVLRQPRFIVAILCGVVSYMMMNFMMTSAPLAMDLCGIPRAHSNYGIEMHVVAMYGPSFFTGRLIGRYGPRAIILCGLGLTAMAALAGMSGLSVHHFWVALILLGAGWNFGFLGASALVLRCHTAEEAPRVQSINDFVVFGAMVIGSFTSGSLLTLYGWSFVTALVLPPVALAAIGLLWLGWFERREAAATA